MKKVLFWPFPQGLISQFLETSIELEFGIKNRKREIVIKKATKIVSDFIKVIEGQKILQKTKKSWFYVYDKEMIENIKNLNRYKAFNKIKDNREEFYPLLVGQYKKEGIAFYKMKKIISKISF